MLVSSSPRARRQGRRVALGRIGDGEMAGLVEDVAGMCQPRFVDQDRAVADIEAGQEGGVRQRGGAHVDADAAHERRQPLGERIGERGGSRRDDGTAWPAHAAFASASLALA